MSEQKHKGALTFVIADIMRHLATAEMKATVVAKEDYVKFKSCEAFKRIANRSRLAIKDLMELLSPESKAVMNSELLDEDVFLQIDGIVAALYAVPPAIRDDIESYVMSRYNVYALNKSQQNEAA